VRPSGKAAADAALAMEQLGGNPDIGEAGRFHQSRESRFACRSPNGGLGTPLAPLDKPTSEASMPENQNRTSKGVRGARSGGDARREPERQKENQKRLRVGADHKTPEMKKGNRGTFP
jgi:hypothetical protein